MKKETLKSLTDKAAALLDKQLTRMEVGSTEEIRDAAWLATDLVTIVKGLSDIKSDEVNQLAEDSLREAREGVATIMADIEDRRERRSSFGMPPRGTIEELLQEDVGCTLGVIHE